MNDDERPAGDEDRAAVGAEPESRHERRQRLRSERLRKWRREARRSRASEPDERPSLLIPRRFIP